MQNLRPFKPMSSDVLVTGELLRDGSNLILNFRINDSGNSLALPKAFMADGRAVVRENGLWNQTCFEMFLKPADRELYYEFNFSLSKKWNQYVFDGYRLPQPPRESSDISLNIVKWDGAKLQVELSGLDSKTEFEVGLTAILKESSGAKHYLALNHAGDKPDFHLAKSFVLKI